MFQRNNHVLRKRGESRSKGIKKYGRRGGSIRQSMSLITFTWSPCFNNVLVCEFSKLTHSSSESPQPQKTVSLFWPGLTATTSLTLNSFHLERFWALLQFLTSLSILYSFTYVFSNFKFLPINDFISHPKKKTKTSQFETGSRQLGNIKSKKKKKNCAILIKTPNVGLPLFSPSLTPSRCKDSTGGVLRSQRLSPQTPSPSKSRNT